MSTTPVYVISEDFHRGRQSWEFVGIYRTKSDNRGQIANILRVEIDKDFYDHQSSAKISAWSAEGWRFFTSLPYEEWHGLLPGTGQRELTPDDQSQFLFIAGELLERYCQAMWQQGVGLKFPRHDSDYRQAQRDGAVPVGGGLATP